LPGNVVSINAEDTEEPERRLIKKGKGKKKRESERERKKRGKRENKHGQCCATNFAQLFPAVSNFIPQ